MRWPVTAGIATLVGLGACTSADIEVQTPPDNLVVLGSGTGHYDAETGQITWGQTDPGSALLDSSNSLPNATAANCEPATWNAGSLVLSVNGRVVNGSTTVTYQSPVELRLTSITEAGVVTSRLTAL